MALPAAGYLSNSGRTVAEQKTALEDVRDFVADLLGGAAREALTIASGAVVPGDGTSGGVIVVDTEAAAASDDLTNITTTNTPNGRLLLVYCANASRVVTVKHNAGGAGQIQLKDSTDFVLNALDKWVLLQLRSTTWVEIERGYGVDYPGLQDHMRLAAVPAHNILCPHQRLVINYATAATITITADAVVLADSSGRLKRFNSLSETLTISATGANGRDVVDNAGAEQASVWYHLFAIGKDDGTLDVFASQVGFPGSGTSIYTRLPSGYTWAGYLGAAYNDGSSNLRDFRQRGAVVTSWSGTGVVNAGTAATYTAVSLASVVPVTAREVDIDIRGVATGAVTSITAVAASEGSGTAADFGFVVAGTGGASSAAMLARTFGRLLLVTAQQFKYFVSASASCTINVTGWTY